MHPKCLQVCATRYEFVEGLLSKIAHVDVQRLSKGSHEDGIESKAHRDPCAVPSDPAAAAAAALPVRRNDCTAVNAARERYMQRKQQQGCGTSKK